MNTIMDDEDDISIFQWLQWNLLTLDKYWSAFTENISFYAIGLISASLVTAILTLILTKESGSHQEASNEVDEKKLIKTSKEPDIDLKNANSTSNDLRQRKGKEGTSRGFEQNSLTKDSNQGGNISLPSVPSSQSPISIVKQAKHAAISKAITEGLTKDEIAEEKRIQSEQLAKIYSLLAENESEMGKLSYEELQNQMSMYTL